MTTANNPENNLSPWQPGQSGNPSGRPRGTRDLAGYVLETTDGGKELVDVLVCLARGVMPNVPVQKGSGPRKDQQVRPADQTGRPCRLRKAIEISETLYIFRLSKVHTVPESCSGFFKYFFKFRLYTHRQLWMHIALI